MKGSDELNKFLAAQKIHYSVALAEIQKGKKQSHWMWYIFPQIAGLGQSETSKFYAISNLEQAQQYLEHPILGSRLLKISKVLLELQTNDAKMVFGTPDDLKLKSSMTLFAEVPNSAPVFKEVLLKFFGGSPDLRTLEKIKK